MAKNIYVNRKDYNYKIWNNEVKRMKLSYHLNH
jgi:hypothetical protein